MPSPCHEPSNRAFRRGDSVRSKEEEAKASKGCGRWRDAAALGAWAIPGTAQCRNWLYEQVARSLARASAVPCDDPRADTFLAMTPCRLRQAGKARESLDRARLLLKDADAIPRHDGEALIAEAEALLGGAKIAVYQPV